MDFTVFKCYNLLLYLCSNNGKPLLGI